ncbi:MAG: MopE-related protein, partial [Myxococcota bacterium]
MAPLFLALLALGQCKKEGAPTEILVSITSAVGIDQLELRAASVSTDWLVLQEDVSGRDLTSEPWTVLISPSDEINGEFRLWAKGYSNNVYTVGKGVTLAFERNRHLEVSLLLEGDFPVHDLDNDSYPRCTGGTEECDCDDSNSSRSPLAVEVCLNQVDDNCSGWPPDEGCPCDSSAPPADCIDDRYVSVQSAGLGICTFGQQACINGVREQGCDSGAPDPGGELANNGLDDDCDGVVDESSACSPVGSTRACFLGLPSDEIAVAIKGTCAAGYQQCLTDGAGGGRWGDDCIGEVRPQRRYDSDANGDPVESFGWAEMDTIASIVDSQCDGLDNDCDGLYDEEPWFDADRDGYTVCGTTFTANGDDPPRNTFTVGNRGSEYLDCNDGNAAINPGVWEACGNFVDEDCRCDHDPLGRGKADPDTVIGQPQVLLDGTVNCTTADTYLSCALTPRSDSTDIGDCDAAPDPYYFGYDAAGDCHYCGVQFGLTCDTSQAVQACMTKAASCSGCATQGTLAASRPSCFGPDTAGCVDAIGALWADVAPSVAADPYDDCTGLSCAGYYGGIVSGRCFARADVSSASHLCKAGGLCQSVADRCSTQPQAADPLPVTECHLVDSGCIGQTVPHETPQAAGNDDFAQCNAIIADCATDVSGEGPFYAGIDGLPAYCYYRATPSVNTCNGTGACRTRAEECSAALQGGAALRPVCKIPVGGCTAQTDPTYATVWVEQGWDRDPYNECSGTTNCCEDNLSNGLCCRTNGASCNVDRECASHVCVDGFCCNTACTGDCDACSAALTASPNGTCAPIDSMVPDTSPSNLCTVTGTGCSAASCICEPTTSICKFANGQTCNANGDCASGECECANGTCSSKVCSAVDCGCTYSNGTSCAGNYITDNYDDADDNCGPSYSCNGQGTCNLANNAVCTINYQCETNECECADTTCSSKLCSAVDCNNCTYSNGSTCSSNYMADNYDDADNTCVASTCDGNGGCNRANGTGCSAGYQCTTNYCVDGLCCDTACN